MKNRECAFIKSESRDMNYYILEGEATKGPFTLGQLRSMWSAGSITAKTMFCQEGDAQWRPLSDLVHLLESPPPGFSSVASPAASQNGNKIAAGVCAILLGALGVHKFILGFTTPGVIMLLVSVLTCGYGLIPMAIIGLIEGILYLTKSDEEFYRIYVVGKRAWF
jgi:TM2 domain-containing membrane protein YozV